MVLEKMNLLVLGHPGSGRATTFDVLFHKILGINKHKVTQMSASSSKPLLEKLKADHERGKTTVASSLKFETINHSFMVTDAPGHCNFIKNLITGTSQADFALLIVDSTVDGFEVGISNGGQTFEHASLAHTLGIKQLIVCFNKMDATTPRYSEERYVEIMNYVSSYLAKIGYDPEKIPFIPISGLEGDNLIERSTNLEWYSGPTLLETLDQLEKPKTLFDKPLRLPIRDFNKIKRNLTFLEGRIEGGILKPDMKITFGPTGHTAKVKSVQICGRDVQEASAGGNVGVCVKVNEKDLCRGYVASNSKDDPAKEAVSFTSLVIITNFPGLLFNGHTLTIDCHEARVAVKVTDILRKIDRRSGKEIEREPKFLKNGDAAVVKMVPIKPVVVEAFSDYPSLGRFVVRDEHQTVVVGVIESVEKKEYDSDASNKMSLASAKHVAGAVASKAGPLLGSVGIHVCFNGGLS